MWKETDRSALSELSTEQLRNKLLTYKGVGGKVADCIMLFGFYRTDVFPADTWIKKFITSIMNKVTRKRTFRKR